MRHEALAILYPSFDTIQGSGDEAFPYDANGNKIAVNEDDVSVKVAELQSAENLVRLRFERDRKLVETDHWALSDTATMTQAQTDYRQALRDITDSYTSLDDVVWPTKP